MSFLFPSSTITIEAALRDLVQGSPKSRAFAAHALGDVTDPTEKARAVEALIVALEDDRPEVRAEAASSLGDLKETSAIPPLVKRLDDGSPGVRQNAAIALGTIAHADAFEPLAEALRQGPADLRFQAATSLAEIDQQRAYDPLVAALGDQDPLVVGAAALSLGAIGDKKAIAVLAPVVDHRDASARFDAAYALAELGDAAGQGILVEAIGDPERAWDAITALATLGATATSPSAARAIEALGRALSDRRVPPEATVLAAGRLLEIAPQSTHSDAAQRVLLAALQARKTHLRGLAVEQLALAGGEWAKLPLEKLARSGKGGELLEPIAAALEAIAKRETR
ncbi:MAG: HEAT repeat domain-containing protein [Myxococcota bacterium]|nr:HEAT repeat domain-containing protein [Myxococcota bacterium]